MCRGGSSGSSDRRKDSRGTIPSYIWKSINASETEIKVDACFAHTSGVGDDSAKAMVAKIKNVLKPILGIKRSAVLVKEFVPLSPTGSLWLPTRWHPCHFNRSPSQNTALLLSGHTTHPAVFRKYSHCYSVSVWYYQSGSQSPDEKRNNYARTRNRQLPCVAFNWTRVHLHIGAISRPKSLLGINVDIWNFIQYQVQLML